MTRRPKITGVCFLCDRPSTGIATGRKAIEICGRCAFDYLPDLIEQATQANEENRRLPIGSARNPIKVRYPRAPGEPSLIGMDG